MRSEIQAFEDEKEASRELVRAKDDILVYHTGKEKIEVPIKARRTYIFWILKEEYHERKSCHYE